jgi:hypothetical protein
MSIQQRAHWLVVAVRAESLTGLVLRLAQNNGERVAEAEAPLQDHQTTSVETAVTVTSGSLLSDDLMTEVERWASRTVRTWRIVALPISGARSTRQAGNRTVPAIESA